MKVNQLNKFLRSDFNIKMDEFKIFERQGREKFSEYIIIYTTFNKFEDVTPENIIDQFTENIISPRVSEVKKYLEKKFEDEWPEYRFQQRDCSFKSNHLNDKNIFIQYEKKKGSLSLDAIIVSK